MNKNVCDRCFDSVCNYMLNFEEQISLRDTRRDVRNSNYVLMHKDGSSIDITHVCPIEIIRYNDKLTHAERDDYIANNRLEVVNSDGKTTHVLGIFNAVYIPEWCVFESIHNLTFREFNNNGISL
ncbi:MAG: hypothetical protein KAS32_11155 [Candidatus Peribacteraceae bacterium]|nr:hypothetical protein [Candidatus Peribacteraceae bacterium]